MMDPEALGRLQSLAGETLDELAAAGVHRGGCRPGARLRGGLAGNATMTALALGIDPEPLGVAPFVHDHGAASRRTRGRARAAPPPAGAGGDVPCAGCLRRRRHRRRDAGHRHGSRQAHPAVHRRRHQLRDRAQQRRHDRLHRRAGRARLRGRRDPLWHAGGRRRDRGGPLDLDDGPSSSAVIGDVEPRGLCGSGLVDAVAELVRVGLLDARGRFVTDEEAAALAPGARRPARRSARSGCSCCTGPTPGRRRGRHASTSPSATCASCSSPRPRSRPAGRCCSSELGLEHGDMQQVLLAGLVRHLPLAGLGGPDRAGAEAAGAAHRLRGQRRGRGREDGPAVPPRARRVRPRCWRRWSMSSSPTAPTSTTGSSTSSPSP